MVEFKFHIKMPIFVARQHMRHRMASVNEMSGRYSELPEEFFTPDTYRAQSSVNKQGSDGSLELERTPEKLSQEAFELYRDMIKAGCSRELARCHLPLSTFTEFYWKIDLHNLMHYLRLRMEPGAQEEIRVYANEIFNIVKGLAPLTMQAFLDFRVNSVTFSGPEIEAFKNGTKLESPGEQREFEIKMKLLSNK
jgi:thymidylate synthase (FAD)